MTNNWLHKWTLINERCLSSLASTRFIIIYLFIMSNWSGAFVMHLWFYVNNDSDSSSSYLHILFLSLPLSRASIVKFPHKVAACVMYCDTKVFQFHAASKSIRIQIHSSVMSFFLHSSVFAIQKHFYYLLFVTFMRCNPVYGMTERCCTPIQLRQRMWEKEIIELALDSIAKLFLFHWESYERRTSACLCVGMRWFQVSSQWK